ncbi:MAG: Na+/H+ antiporter subunit E [Gammaproteobacteria bacterium]
MLSSIVTRAAILAGLWWLIVQGQPDAWLVGVPAVAIATLVSSRLGSRHALPRLSLTGLLAFVALFLRESIRGGLDVAFRTLGPRLRIEPGFHSYRMHTSHPAARVLLINCIGLLPGTLAADLDGDHAELHLLDNSVDPEPQLLRLEQAIVRLFGLTMETDNV